MSKDKMDLELENRTYLEKRPDLLSRVGEFVVIYRDEIVGVFPTYSEALLAGYRRTWKEPFLVKKIELTVIEELVTLFLFPS